MSRQPAIFTPTAVEIIRGLARQGRSAPEIADAIGSTPASVRAKCSLLKIRLRRGRPGIAKQRLSFTCVRQIMTLWNGRRVNFRNLPKNLAECC